MQAARKLVAASSGPLGIFPLQKVVRSELAFFDELRQSGASWSQIASLMRGVGLRTKAGEPVSADILRATFAREAAKRRGCSAASDAVEHRKEFPKLARITSPLTRKTALGGLNAGDKVADRMRRAVALRKAGKCEQ